MHDSGNGCFSFVNSIVPWQQKSNISEYLSHINSEWLVKINSSYKETR